jgi:hypothetical protein
MRVSVVNPGVPIQDLLIFFYRDLVKRDLYLCFAWMKRENKKRERGERECEKREI